MKKLLIAAMCVMSLSAQAETYDLCKVVDGAGMLEAMLPVKEIRVKYIFGESKMILGDKVAQMVPVEDRFKSVFLVDGRQVETKIYFNELLETEGLKYHLYTSQFEGGVRSIYNCKRVDENEVL